MRGLSSATELCKQAMLVLPQSAVDAAAQLGCSLCASEPTSAALRIQYLTKPP